MSGTSWTYIDNSHENEMMNFFLEKGIFFEIVKNPPLSENKKNTLIYT